MSEIPDAPSLPDPPCALAHVRATRFEGNPLITEKSSAAIGNNINGPSVIRVPDWIERPLGRYYMYFGHHGGKNIRLAYADAPTGPWTVHDPGTLQLEQATPMKGHIASPDVHVDETHREIRMYYHGPAADRGGQWTSVATSQNGIDFTSSNQILGKFYFRVWPYDGAHYAIAKWDNEGWGLLYRSADGIAPFEVVRPILRQMRHCAVHVIGHTLVVLYSRAGDAPESILAATVDMRPDPSEWQASEPVLVLQPEADYEGIEHENKPSRYGSAIGVRQLRDPGIFAEDGTLHLYYSFAGEEGIAHATLDLALKPDA